MRIEKSCAVIGRAGLQLEFGAVLLEPRTLNCKFGVRVARPRIGPGYRGPTAQGFNSGSMKAMEEFVTPPPRLALVV